MLEIIVPGIEFFDELNDTFIQVPDTKLHLEHSLAAISKWESKYCVPYLLEDDRTYEQNVYYIQCMTLDEDVDPLVYDALTMKNIADIKEYMEKEQSATTISSVEKSFNRDRIITSELIYYWMTALNIPFECDKWFFGRLMKLISVCSEENAPRKKKPKDDVKKQYRELNAKRRAMTGSKG